MKVLDTPIRLAASRTPRELLLIGHGAACVAGAIWLGDHSWNIYAYAAVTDAPERSLSISARATVSLAGIYSGQEQLSDVLARASDVSEFLLARAPAWLGEP